MKSIRSQLLVAFALLVLLPTAAVSISSLTIGFKSGKQRAIAQLDAISRLKEAEVLTWFQDLQSQLNFVLGEEQTQKNAAMLLSGMPATDRSSIQQEQMQRWFLRVTELTRWFDELFLMTLSGDVVLTSDPTKELQFRYLQPYFTEGLKKPGVHLQTLSYSSSNDGLNTLVAANPVYDWNGQVIGVLCGRAGLQKLNEIMRRRTGMGETGEFYLIGENHVLLSSLRLSEYNPGTTYIHSKGANAALDRHITDFGAYSNYRGIPVVGVYRWIPDHKVAFMAEQSRTEIFRPLYTILTINAIIGAGALCLAVAASLFYTRSLASPLMNLADTASKIADGDLELSAKIERQDEIGTLAEKFNIMTTRLRQRIEREKLVSERYALAQKTAAIASWDWNIENGHINWSQTIDAIFGFDTKDFKGTYDAFLEIVHPQDRQLVSTSFTTCLRECRNYTVEHRIVQPDKSVRWVFQSGDIYRDDTGCATRIIGIMQDITNRKNSERELELYRAHLEDLVNMRTAQLQNANEELSQYAYVVSHDLKAPLRAMHNYADFLREDLENTLDDEQQSYLTGLGQAVQEAEALVENLLELSRIERHFLRFVPVDMKVFISDLVTSLNLSADVRLENHMPWPTLDTEPTLVRQIFQNLINNGVKFNTSEQKVITIGWKPAADQAFEFYVRDNGIGIDSRYHTQIFRVFERLHTREDYEGTGMGLPIVSKAVHKLQGSVRVSSAPGRGSTFYVTLPNGGTDANGITDS